MATIAATDLSRAVRIMLEDPDTTRIGSVVDAAVIPAWFGSRMISDLDDPAEIAREISASGEAELWKDRMLNTTLSRWAVTDLEGAMSWMQSNLGSVSITVLESFGQQLGVTDLDSALSLADMLPPERRPDWIQHTIVNAAMADVNRALITAERYSSEAFYGSLMANIVGMVAAIRGNEAAAQLLFNTSSPPPSAVTVVSRRWAQSDPEAAAIWAVGLPSSEARATAVSHVAATWAESDIDVATAWVEGLNDQILRENARLSICRRFPEAVGCG